MINNQLKKRCYIVIQSWDSILALVASQMMQNLEDYSERIEFNFSMLARALDLALGSVFGICTLRTT